MRIIIGCGFYFDYMKSIIIFAVLTIYTVFSSDYSNASEFKVIYPPLRCELLALNEAGFIFNVMGKMKYPILEGEKKECGTCRLIKSLSDFSKTKTHYEARCKNCHNIYSHNRNKRPEIKEKNHKYIKEYRAIKKNREKINANARMRGKRPEIKLKRNELRKKWTLKQKRKAIEYKGGKCIICGYNKCEAALEFHHKDPLKKIGYGTSAIKSHKTFERNKNEIDKCILVCARCHREIHAKYITI